MNRDDLAPGRTIREVRGSHAARRERQFTIERVTALNVILRPTGGRTHRGNDKRRTIPIDVVLAQYELA